MTDKATLDVSRETLERLQAFYDLLRKWNPKINLVSKASLNDAWARHIIDSAQIYDLTGTCDLWADFGSGGGFPALVVAIIAKEKDPVRKVVLVESDQRKAVFLRTVIRDLDLNASVEAKRIEDLSPLQADVVSARALADLTTLLTFTKRHLKPSGRALFFKGETWKKEVEDARESWSFDLVAHRSKTNSEAAILEVKEIRRV
jgi:16S rRNA (guanine527-N7)-methyltransferase